MKRAAEIGASWLRVWQGSLRGVRVPVRCSCLFCPSRQDSLLSFWNKAGSGRASPGPHQSPQPRLQFLVCLYLSCSWYLLY